jgi:hypothetical protein
LPLSSLLSNILFKKSKKPASANTENRICNWLAYNEAPIALRHAVSRALLLDYYYLRILYNSIFKKSSYKTTFYLLHKKTQQKMLYLTNRTSKNRPKKESLAYFTIFGKNTLERN